MSSELQIINFHREKLFFIDIFRRKIVSMRNDNREADYCLLPLVLSAMRQLSS